MQSADGKNPRLRATYRGTKQTAQKRYAFAQFLFFRRRRKNKDTDGIFRFHTAVMY